MMGKGALVTGGSSGIGRGIVRMLAEEGFDIVFGHFQDDANATSLVREVEEASNSRCEAFDGDLTQSSVVLELARFAVASLGAISVLVNNAGVTQYTETREASLETIDALYALVFRAPVVLTRELSRHMISSQLPGVVINIASTRAFRAYPQDSVYGGMKAALVRATESMALDLAPFKIRVNAVAPGAIRVREDAAFDPFYAALGPRIPQGRVGRPQDVAEVVRWLISDRAGYVTGSTVRVDGGLILPGMPEHVPEGFTNYGWGALSERTLKETSSRSEATP